MKNLEFINKQYIWLYVFFPSHETLGENNNKLNQINEVYSFFQIYAEQFDECYKNKTCFFRF